MRAARPPGDDESRVDRLEHVVDSVAAEVERMAEGQRFVSRLLAERTGYDGRTAAAARPAHAAATTLP